MEPSRSRTSPDSAAEEDLSGFGSKQPVYSDLDAKSDLGKKPSQRMQSRAIIMYEVWELNKKKDVVCFILSYPPFNSRNNETHGGWIRHVLEINHKVREELHTEKEVSISELSSEITRLLHHSIHDIEAHVPSDIIGKMCEWWSPRHTTPKKAMLDLCIDDFMIRQFLQGIQIPEIRRILISEVNDETFLCRLKNLPPIRQMFDLVIQVNVKFCLKIKDIEDRIIEELGFSTSSRGEAEQLLRSQNFLILLDDFDTRRINLHDLGNGWWNSDNTQKIALISFLVHPEVPVDLEIKRNHHLLSWELFSMNVGEVVHSSTIQKLAVHVLKQCSGHLLATVLMARALKEVKDVRIWQHASRVISFLPTSHTEDRILLNALSFVLGHLGSANKYVKYCASYLEIEGTYKVDLLERWMNEDLIGTLDEGEQIVQHLVNALLLESFQNGQSIRMRDEIRKELMNFYKAETNPILLVELDGRGLMEAPKNGVWEEANEMHLMNNKISKLPDNPNSPKLSVLFLQGDDRYGVLQSLEYLYLHYMKNLRSIWKGPPIWMGLLSNLKVLALHTCPELATIFTFNILQQCCNLEELVVEDCPEINSIVNHKVLAKDVGPWAWYLPKLKKMSIHYMPKLVSISQGVLIAPNLEWLSLYDCPSLKILSPEEVSSCKLKVIIGEADWWSALEWKKSERFQPPNLDAIFVPIERDIDLRTQLAEINDQLQAQMQKTEPSQQSGSGDSLKAPAVEAGTSAKQKQMKLGHLFMKWPLSELHPFLIQVP
ncbi:unnamed protein product, partial [Vitis vinifera]|uniref:Disease resistance protein At4g27190-like leucine-rich repeats domain-containing protein n=1 Tax=Vitis vinifera TaxID=29760 RepID=D7U3T7_VITVI